MSTDTSIEERIRASVEALDGEVPGPVDAVLRGRRRRRAVRGVAGCLAVVVAVAMLAGLSELLGGSAPDDRIEPAHESAGDGATRLVVPDDRDAPIVLSGQSVDHEDLDVADLRGSVVVVRFWYSACLPCREDVPVLTGLVDRPGVVGLGVSVEDSAKTLRDADRELAMPFDSIWIRGRTLLDSIRGYPTTWVLDRQGRLAVSVPGQLDPADLDPVIDSLLAERDPSQELADHSGEHCPEVLPDPDTASDGWGLGSAARTAPRLSIPDAVWRCSYEAFDVAPPGSNGASYQWRLTDEAVPLDATQIDRFTATVAELVPPGGGVRACTDELGLRHLFAFDHDGDLTGVVVDDFGCGDVRLTDEPFETVPGEASQPGVVAGVLEAPRGSWDGLID